MPKSNNKTRSSTHNMKTKNTTVVKRSKKNGGSKNKKMELISTALAPLSLIAMQQYVSKNITRKGKKKSASSNKSKRKSVKKF